LENARTNEVLTLYNKNRPYGSGVIYLQYYIARYPKGEENWKEEGENKIREYQKMQNSTTIFINIA